jgi:hypothetical protein
MYWNVFVLDSRPREASRTDKRGSATSAATTQTNSIHVQASSGQCKSRRKPKEHGRRRCFSIMIAKRETIRINLLLLDELLIAGLSA